MFYIVFAIPKCRQVDMQENFQSHAIFDFLLMFISSCVIPVLDIATTTLPSTRRKSLNQVDKSTFAGSCY